MSVILRKYGVAATFNFPLFSVGTNSFKTDATHASGDSVISKDEGAQANTTNGFVDEGSFYSLTLTATEMEAARIAVVIIDQGTKEYDDQMLVIETYGNASAQHEFDLDTAIGSSLSTFATGTLEGSLSRDAAQRVMLSALAGKVSGAGTGTETFRDTADSKNRIVSTVDSSGNRTAVTLDGA